MSPKSGGTERRKYPRYKPEPGMVLLCTREEAGGMIGVNDLKLSRILNAPPTPYTRERFEDNYNWTLGWGLVPPGATYENTVDNRAWQ